ncbi:hypothetical protein LZ30DRAFT_804370 [Colletotrichum cereale]|nr:hypothetical protein LZ30DRAFT_804370 [Colletotrichum cereale]
MADTSDLADPLADRGPELSATTTTLLVLATVFVGFRFWSRWVVRFKYGADDWFMVAGLVVTFMAGAINYAMIGQGLGRHAATLTLDNQVEFLKLLLAFECIYVTAVMLVKVSLLLMYCRIFPSSNFRIAAITLGGITVAWWIAIVCVCIFQCTPIEKAYMPFLDGHCIDLKASFIGNAIPNILTDVAILCLPVGQVWKLQATLTHRLSLCFMFLLGGFVLFASIYRFTTLMQFQIADTTWTLATACTWCVVECACGVISACLPTLRPLMMKISTKFGNVATNRGATELVTIGGSGGKSADKGFHRLKTDERKYGVTTTITNQLDGTARTSVDTDLGEKDSLDGGIRIKVNQEICWNENLSQKNLKCEESSTRSGSSNISSNCV